MKWLYIVVGVLVFLVIGKVMNEYSFRDIDPNVEILHSGAQP